MRIPLKQVLLAATVIGLGSLTAATTAQATAAPSWKIVHTNTAQTVGTDVNKLNDIVALGPKNVWAVGDIEVDGGATNWSLAQRWDGRKWHTTKLPPPFDRVKNRDSYLSTVAASGPGNVWAFGGEGDSHKYALRWNGTKWTIAHRWTHGNARITDALVLGPRNVWVFGGDSYESNSLGTWHFDGTKWSRIDTPGFRIIKASSLGPNNIWAVVTKHTEHTTDGRFAARFDGSTWKLVPTPNIPGTWQDTPSYQAVYAQSANNVWLVGGREVRVGGEEKENPIALRWNGSAWKRFDGPRGHHNSGGLSSAIPDGTGGIWATRGGGYSGDVVRLNAGKWAVASLPKVPGKWLGIGQLVRTPGSPLLWATGRLAWGGYPATNGVVLRHGG